MLMKALTVYQPWASLVALGEKKIETRGWYTKYRGPLAIHAGKAAHLSYQALANMDATFNRALTGSKEWNPVVWETLPFGSVIAICNLADCLAINEDGLFNCHGHARNRVRLLPTGNELAFGDYTPGRFAWILEDVHRLQTPIMVKGHQRLWNFDYEAYQIAVDPWVIGDTQIWTPQGIRRGKQVPPGKEDAVMGLEVA